MKFWDLLLISIIFNLVGVALTDAGLFTAMGMDESISFSDITDEEKINEMDSAVQDSIAGELTPEDPDTGIFTAISRAITQGVNNFFISLRKYIYFPAMIMQQFGLPRQLGNAVSVLFTIFQVMAVLQLVTGRSFKSME